MLEITSDADEVIKIYATTVESKTIDQIKWTANSPAGRNSHIRIMPDCHYGAGCCVGTTMKVTDKVVPNLVGVDIGCGVALARFNINLENNLARLDGVIRKVIPFGMKNNSKQTIDEAVLSKMYCWKNLSVKARDSALCALGSLGGGNHFIEAYKDGYLSVHSGSRNIGLQVAKYYQGMASKCMQEAREKALAELIKATPEQDREKVLKEWKCEFSAPSGLEYLTEDLLEQYLHDQAIMVQFAKDNRKAIIDKIAVGLRTDILDYVECTHNYIGKDNILRKGSISARKGELCLIPLNMRDGLLICEGKGNEDWNYSAPHGAGRLYSRAAAKRAFSVEQYRKSMKGIFSTCITEDTLDEAPFAYKDMQEIIAAIEPTVKIKQRIEPIYNFKASE